jgi:hypothetical protein
MMIIDSLLSFFQRDPLVPNQKEGIDSSKPRFGKTPDNDAAPTIEYERPDWEIGRSALSPRICISENALPS